jgi:DNA-binding FadR family transcriptional regulator
MSLTAPVRSSTLSAQVASQMEQLITSGRWPVGTRIPAESELVTQLGMSRNTVREALRSLVHSGMLDARVGDGTYVRAHSELAAPLVRRAHRGRLDDAVELRAVLERAAAGLAARRRSSQDAIRLRQLLSELRNASAAGDRAAYAAADQSLHQAVAGCSGNELLAEVYEHLGGALKLSVSPELWDQTLAEEEVDLHEALVKAIVEQKPAGAEAAATRLVAALRAAVLPRPSGRRRKST